MSTEPGDDRRFGCVEVAELLEGMVASGHLSADTAVPYIRFLRHGSPWEIVSRVPVLPQYENGEPAPDGEILVRLTNYQAMPVPEAFAGMPEISLVIAYPVTDVGKERNVLAGSMVTSERARQLAAALWMAADVADGKVRA